jgi:pyocin large subunit-like protein
MKKRIPQKIPEGFSSISVPSKRITFASLAKDFADAGVPEITRKDYRAVILRLLQLTEGELKTIFLNAEAPMYVRFLIEMLRDKSSRRELMRDLRDYVLGQNIAEPEVAEPMEVIFKPVLFEQTENDSEGDSFE